MPRVTLYPQFQQTGLESVLKSFHARQAVFGLFYCTGSGKTLMAQAIAARVLAPTPTDPEFTHVVFASPMETLKETFGAKYPAGTVFTGLGGRQFVMPVILDDQEHVTARHRKTHMSEYLMHDKGCVDAHGNRTVLRTTLAELLPHSFGPETLAGPG